MPLNDAAFTLAANCLQTGFLYAQLHTGAAGVLGTDNVVSVRVPVFWGTIDGGDFSLLSPLRFFGGTPNGPVYSVSLWDAGTSGTFYGEYPLTDGDLTFNGEGAFQVTALDFIASSPTIEGS